MTIHRRHLRAPHDRRRRTGSSDHWSRAFLVGFVVGIAITLPAVYLALIFNVFEALLEFVVPASLLLRPLSSHMADWNGAVNVGLTAVVNGLVYGAAAVAAAWRLGAARSQRST